ncbi:hypothetical protein [Aromatoleum anaerobium]|uniref:Uncharacterized protein n=1 Tax=Aromatoleum anaerobium TaxID=182180 RepID=A0ABX1PT58_9RHOO|nr:hypothetical protein [Aromatoleum anaerobium]MCK0508479.1 hypothetical protein [Aromatoleum anaerobium]
MSAAPDLSKKNGVVTLGAARHGLLVEAAAEIAALCLVMHSTLDPACEIDSRAMRGFVARLLDLSNAAISALDDELERTTDIAGRVRIALPETGGDA